MLSHPWASTLDLTLTGHVPMATWFMRNVYASWPHRMFVTMSIAMICVTLPMFVKAVRHPGRGNSGGGKDFQIIEFGIFMLYRYIVE
jgi:hypothetical protein